MIIFHMIEYFSYDRIFFNLFKDLVESDPEKRASSSDSSDREIEPSQFKKKNKTNSSTKNY